MPRYRVHRAPSDDDSSERTVSFDPTATREPRRKGLLARFKKEDDSTAPWETESGIAKAGASELDRNVPATSRLGNVGKARIAPTDSGLRPLSAKTSASFPAFAETHTNHDTDAPWAEATEGVASDAMAELPPPPSPVPPGPPFFWTDDESAWIGDRSAVDPGFDSDSLWSAPLEEGLETDPTTKGTQPDFAPPRFEGATAFDLETAVATGDGFLGTGDFDMDVGFTPGASEQGEKSPPEASGSWDASLGALGFADDPDETGTVDGLTAAPASGGGTPGSRTNPATTWGDDLSYPDIPSLTAEDALSRGRELLAADNAEDALTVLEMGLRMAPGHSALTACVELAEHEVLAEILPDAKADRRVRMAGPAPDFADPRDARLVASLSEPRHFAELRADHAGMSMREFAGRLHAMLSMRILRWD